MRKFIKENFWWIMLVIVTFALLIPTFYLPNTETGQKIENILLFPFCIIGAIIIIVGIFEIVGYFYEKNCIKQTWQGCFIFLILALSIIALAK